MKRTFSYKITEKDTGKTIEIFLLEHEYTPSCIKHLKKAEKRITVNGNWEFVNKHLKEGDILGTTFVEEESSENIVPVEMPLDIVYEDEDILVLNKAANMPIHPSKGYEQKSLAKICLETGRTHQIRLHMRTIGHPLPADCLYNPNFNVIGRYALHSWKLEFPHPITKKLLVFEQELPEDMKNIFGKVIVQTFGQLVSL